MNIRVEIDPRSGFCHGVVRAVEQAENYLQYSPRLYSLGAIVHNSVELERLKKKGLEILSIEEVEQLHDDVILVRAHGEPPETYRTAQRLGIHLIDATCPIVLALQQRIRKGYDEMRDVGGQIVIFGKPGHAEVVGLSGQTDGTAVIVSSPDDIAAVDTAHPIRLYSQTTKSREEYRRLIENLQRRLPEGADFVAYEHKHNEANRENNADGPDDNASWNCGVEGPTDDPDINRLRHQ